MKKIHVPDSANLELEVYLNGLTYIFHYKYSTLSDRYYLDIYLDGSLIVAGLKLVTNVLLLEKYALDGFNHGDLAVVRLKNTSSVEPERDTLGFNKEFELIYFTNEELGRV